MKKKKLLMMSVAITGLLSLSGCSNCKFCNWFESCLQKVKGAFSEKTKSSSKKIVSHAITAIEDYNAFQAIIQSEKPVVIKLHAPWCGACEEMQPIFEKLSEEMPEIAFASLDIDKVSDVAREYGIKGVPTFLMFKHGKEVMSSDRVIGVVGHDEFKKILEESLVR